MLPPQPIAAKTLSSEPAASGGGVVELAGADEASVTEVDLGDRHPHPEQRHDRLADRGLDRLLLAGIGIRIGIRVWVPLRVGPWP